jgi:hypothetical protein
MPLFPRLIQSLAICINFFSVLASNTQSQDPPPTVVLEATSILRGIGSYEKEHLLSRLTNDGKVEWDKYVANKWERQTSSVTSERVSEIQRRLDSVDKSLLHDAMGPYYIYVDTSTEVKIRTTAKQRDVAFSVQNPWPPGIIPSHKPMPKDVKAVLCEIDRLQAQVANLPIREMCKPRDSSH